MKSRYKSYKTVEDLPKLAGETVTLRGWVYKKTGKGKLQFIQLRYGTGIAQCVVFKNNVTEEAFAKAKALTQESSLTVTGKVVASGKAPGGYEIDAAGLEIIHISQDYPISAKEHGDSFLIEHRHLWLRSARQHAIMRVRAVIIKAIRDFFDASGFKLMDSPILTPNACEGTSTLFETKYFDLGKAYLSQSGQLYAEASAMALGKVYTFGPVFRAERSKTRKHLTEFWMVEPEMAFFDLDDDMDLAEDLVEYIVECALRSCQKEFAVLQRDISALERIKRPFYRISYSEAVEWLQKNKVPIIRKIDGRDVESPFPWGEDFGTVQEEALMEQFDKPCIIHRYPAAVKAFYMKRDPADDKLSLAMDMLGPEKAGEIIGGSQREDDYDTMLERIKEDKLDEADFKWFLDLRKYGSVPHSGFGLGVERVVKWITGAKHIRETIPMPRMIHRIIP